MVPENRSTIGPMARRIALVCGLVSLATLLAALWISSIMVSARLQHDAAAQVADAARNYGRELQARLLTIESIVEAVSAGDAGAGGALLRQRALRSGAIRGAVVLYASQVDAGSARAPVRLMAPDRLALAAGQTLMRAVNGNRDRRALYLMRATTLAGAAGVAFFEVAPDWLWSDLGPEGFPGTLAVVDHTGALLAVSATAPAELLAMLARERESSIEPGSGPGMRAWQVAGREWRGAVMPLLPSQLRLDAPRWSVIACDAVRAAGGFTVIAGGLPWLLLLLLCGLIAAGASWHLQRRWEPVLDALCRALAALGAGRFERVALDAAAESPRATAVAFNRAVDAIEERMLVLGSLAEIDRLLLESSELEGALEAVLARVCHVTACHGAQIALLDPDAPGYARAYLAAGDGAEQPVSRIAIDAEMLEFLAAHPEGITITRCEPERHSVLEPLRALGAEFFWAWPVLSQQRVAAVLAVGYRGAPAVPAEVAGFGTQCAQRLGVRLSNSVRDEQLYRQAHFDALTALPNRLLFRDRLSQELASSADGPQRGALLYVDLDHFKKINDSLGHGAGDQLLTIVAQRLRSCVKDGDTVARLGGDEFTVILRNVGSAEAAQQVAARLIETLQQPVHISGRDQYVRASIGITLFPDDGAAIDDLMRNADLAMYQAKQSGRSRAVFFDRKMERSAGQSADSGLFRALRRREFSLYYQPQYALSDGRLSGLEALLRWQPPRESMRYPGDFIPAAEQSGLIIDIGAWVLETACNQLAIWREQGIAPPRLALNVSVHQLRQPEFPLLVRRALDRVGVPPELLEIELTESVFADDDAHQSLRRLAALGVRLALDDFGTGYSSLGYLRQHPVQVIKIDRSFIDELPHSFTAATLAETIIAMAHALGKQVVAEGVETLEQLEFLRERGCDAAQGFFLAHPRPAAEITELLSARRPAVALLDAQAAS
jgi:diguanylate cyclase (GGDEF)-like protein